MNKNIFLGIWMLLLSAITYAQQPPADPGDDRKGKVEAAKIGFITKELNLTPEEAKTFWPIYDQFHTELDALNKKRSAEMLNTKINFDNMSDEEVSKTIDNEFGYQQQELDLKKKYNAEFKKVLPVKKVAKYWVAEQKFKIFLLNQLKDEHPGGMGPRGQGQGQGGR